MILLPLLAATAHASSPTVIVAGGVGMPNLLHAHAEVFVAEQWSVEVGGGVGLLPPLITAGVRWSPESTCFWTCWEGHGVRLSPGVTWYFPPSLPQEGLATLNADLAWFWRGESGWGVTAGVRLGLGIAYGQVADGTKIEPGGEVVPLQVGIVR